MKICKSGQNTAKNADLLQNLNLTQNFFLLICSISVGSATVKSLPFKIFVQKTSSKRGLPQWDLRCSLRRVFACNIRYQSGYLVNTRQV